MDKEYIARKISNCKALISTAISPEQKKIYQAYLEFWQKKLPPQNDEIYDDSDYETMFKIEFPNKKSHYKRNGKLYPTKAFKTFVESLISLQ